MASMDIHSAGRTCTMLIAQKAGTNIDALKRKSFMACAYVIAAPFSFRSSPLSASQLLNDDCSTANICAIDQ